MAAKRKLAEQIFGAEENSAAKMDPEKLSKFQRLAARMYHTPQLSAKEVGIPAIASFGAQLSGMINGNYRMYYFISVLRLDMVYVTIINSLISIYDMLNNPIIGILYDKTRTRWGKARPYALLTPVFVYASTALLFCARLFFDNDDTRDPGKVLFVFAVLFLQETFSTIASAGGGFVGLMTPNLEDRMRVGLWQTYSNKWGGDLLAMIIMPLLDFARSDKINATPAGIFAFFGILAAVAGTAGSMLMAVKCRERVILQPEPAPTSKTMFYILKNKYMLRNFVAGLSVSWWNKGGLNWDVITQLEIFGGVFRTWPWYIPRQTMQIVSIQLVEPFKRMFRGSYRKTVIFMRVWDWILGSIPALMGLSPKIIGTWWKAGLAFAAFDGLVVSNDAPSTVMEAEINRRISDYTEYTTGERPDGTIGLLTGFISKVTEPLRALWTIAVLKWAGYDPNIASNKPWLQARVHENSTMYSKVFFLYNFTDILPNLIGIIPLIFYDLEGQKLEDMYTALNERRALIAKENTVSGEMAAMIEMMAEEDLAEQKT
ncbi:MAG: MFS transporter [Oscillospiraceae bacterium]|nr:MFS transporter [Oscillospiraceae bacterium]